MFYNKHSKSSSLFSGQFDQYVNDTQLYLLMDCQLDLAQDLLGRASQAVAGWLQQSRLKLNPTKTVVLYLSHGGTGRGIQLPALGGATLMPLLRVRRLGVILDALLSMEAQ